jgi:hypothetical protein
MENPLQEIEKDLQSPNFIPDKISSQEEIIPQLKVKLIKYNL